MSDSDSDAPIARKHIKKPIVDDSDDDAPVVRKPAPKKVVTASDDDEGDEPVSKIRAKAVSDDSDDDDDGPVIKKSLTDDDDVDDDGATIRTQHTDPMATVLSVIDYDAMSDKQFEEHLQQVSKRQRMQDMQRSREAKKVNEAVEPALEAYFDGEPNSYSYKFMLDRILSECFIKNPELAEDHGIRLPAPKIEKSGSKKTALTNFKAICNAAGRTVEEVKEFVDRYLMVKSDIDANNCLIIRIQNAKQAQFEKMLDRYVEQYVRCNSCHKINTDLCRDSSSRLQVMTCRNCKSSRNVSTDQPVAYHAQTVRRARQRARMI